jgi:2-hydroxy-3-keto-5-methylthiopentenyl-1-phosphate phosphatase
MLGDTGHVLFDNHGCGEHRRKELDAAIHCGGLSFRDASDQMWGSLNVPLEDGFQIMKEKLEMDPGFLDFHVFCLKEQIPFSVISAGIKPVLRRILDEFVGEQGKDIEIIANDALISEDGTEWKVVWKDDSKLGHDKAVSIQEAKAIAAHSADYDEPPLILFIGDGVSDLPAARECDVLFARRGLRLEEYCIENKIDYIPFDTFKDIECEVIRIIKDGRRTMRNRGLSKFYSPKYIPESPVV